MKEILTVSNKRTEIYANLHICFQVTTDTNFMDEYFLHSNFYALSLRKIMRFHIVTSA